MINKEFGTSHYVNGKIYEKFFNFECAFMAMQQIEFFYARLGMLTSSYVAKETGVIELSVHFDNFNMVPLPAGYNYTQRKLASHPFHGRGAHSTERTRVQRYEFKF